MKAGKFKDNIEHLYQFHDEFLVECPKCKSLAKVLPENAETDFHIQQIFYSRKLVCAKCGLNKIWKSNGISSIQMSPREKQIPQESLIIGGNFDWYFQEPLWLQIECCGETLWAYNRKHLEFIENYVSATLRERIPNVNQSLASRLPKWMKQAKNREAILKAIEKLKKKLHGKF